MTLFIVLRPSIDFQTSLNKVPIFKVLHIWVPNYFSSLIFHYSPKTTPCNKKIKSWYHLKMPYSFLVPSFQLCHLFTLDIPTKNTLNLATSFLSLPLSKPLLLLGHLQSPHIHPVYLLASILGPGNLFTTEK